MLKLILKIIFFITISTPSYSYLGPGVGGGIIASVIGIIVAIFAVLFGLIWFPLKKILNKKKKKSTNKN